MSNKHKKKEKPRSLIYTVRNSLRHIYSNKPQKVVPKRNLTPTPKPSGLALEANFQAMMYVQSEPHSRKSSVKSSRVPPRKPQFPTLTSSRSHKHVPSHSVDTMKSPSSKRVLKRSKSSSKYLLPISVPSLYINQRPETFDESTSNLNTFNHLLYDDEKFLMDKVIIPISIDIEAVYNEMYDNNYNRKVLGPIQRVQFPLIIDCVSNPYAHLEEIDSDSDDDKKEDEVQWKRAQQMLFRHQKSASISAGSTTLSSSASTSDIELTRQRTHTAAAGSSHNQNVEFSKRRREYFKGIDSRTKDAHRKREKVQKNLTQSSGERVSLKFEDKYSKMNKITPDELEILARKLLLRKVEEESSYAWKQSLHNNVKKKAESVSFGLQLINSIKQITSTLTRLMDTFSDGLDDLLGICSEFIELMISPLPRCVRNDYDSLISKYNVLLDVMSGMRVNMDESSLKLRNTIPMMKNVLGSDINTRISEYEMYISDLNKGDTDLCSLQTHCDRTLRRLFREIPKPYATASRVSKKNEPQLTRKKSLKQHRNIRVFGSHYVSSNSNEYICRSVPAKVRRLIISDYIHYLTLMETMNVNKERCYNDILPAINDEFEFAQKELSSHIENTLQNIHENVSSYHCKTSTSGDRQHLQLYNRNGRNRRNGNRNRTKPLAPVKVFCIHHNELMASPMHTFNVIANINEYVNEESEKKTYDEFEMVKAHKKSFNKQKKQENGRFALKNFRIQFDSAHFINEEVIASFFSNHYYHLGDIMFEIPELYSAFENYLRMQLSVENLLFLKRIDEIYFNFNLDQKDIIHEAKDIYREFIREDGENQINIPGNIRKRIHTKLKQIQNIKDPLSIFDKAYDGISQLIHKQSLPNFYKSLHFRKWYEKAREENEKLWKKERKMMKK